MRLPGSFQFRFAARTLRALLFQLPPRMTRFEPGVTASRVEEVEVMGAQASGGGFRSRSSPRQRFASAWAVIARALS